MCRLLGVISKDGVPTELLDEFVMLAEKGKIGADFGCSGDKTRGHKDGWGIAVLGEKEIFFKEALPATESKKIKEVLKELEGVKNLALLMHLRRASDKSTICAEHTHPFYAEHGRRKYFFAHNGSLENYKAIAHGGMIDSEYIFQQLMNNIDKGLIASVRKLSQSLSYTALNFILLSEGEIYAYRDAKKCVDYFSLYYATKGTLSVVCSERLSQARMRWKKMKNPSLLRMTGNGVEVLL